MTLHASQASALRFIGDYARARREAARATLAEVLRMSDIGDDALARVVAAIRTHARVALHFHPDRLASDGVTIAESLLRDGVYKSQFETAISNGSVSAFAGGARDQWENALFGGAYHIDGVTNAQRPKYGALDLLGHGDGPSPRFGSAYVLLHPAVSRRCTFTYLDSHDNPPERGTYDEFDDILAALFRDAFVRESALGEALTPTMLLQRLNDHLGAPFADPRGKTPARNLNHYIEAQIHGDIRLQDDAAILVADSAFESSDIGDVLRAIGERYALPLYWHAGFVLAADDVPRDFRGATMPAWAARVAVEGQVDAAAIGRAAQAIVRAQPANAAAELQALKLLWHVLVRFGRPRP